MLATKVASEYVFNKIMALEKIDFNIFMALKSVFLSVLWRLETIKLHYLYSGQALVNSAIKREQKQCLH